MATDIVIRDVPGEGRVTAEFEGFTASAWYEHERGVMRFVQVSVPDELKGKGVTTQLLRVALLEARSRKMLVEPCCGPFLAYMRDHPETQDLLSSFGRHLLEA